MMTVATNTIISITEANQNFSKVTNLVGEHGTAVIPKNNIPRNHAIDFNKGEKVVSTEDVMVISENLMQKNIEVYKMLGK